MHIAQSRHLRHKAGQPMPRRGPIRGYRCSHRGPFQAQRSHSSKCQATSPPFASGVRRVAELDCCAAEMLRAIG